MSELLWSMDRAVFLFLNNTLATPVGDVLWPLITDYDRILVVRVVLVTVWIMLLWKGGTRGRTVALLVIPLLVISDQLSSTVIKQLVDRPRPCHLVDGVLAVPEVRLLVPCGGGKSFPSSHAVNNFALALLFSSYYRRWTAAFVAFASLVALSRAFVGVHYPADILGGSLIGSGVGAAVVWGWRSVTKRYFPSLVVPEPGGGP